MRCVTRGVACRAPPHHHHCSCGAAGLWAGAQTAIWRSEASRERDGIAPADRASRSPAHWDAARAVEGCGARARAGRRSGQRETASGAAACSPSARQPRAHARTHTHAARRALVLYGAGAHEAQTCAGYRGPQAWGGPPGSTNAAAAARAGGPYAAVYRGRGSCARAAPRWQ